MNEFFKFMATRWGRLTRFIAGMLIAAWGVGYAHFVGYTAAGIGVLAMFAAATDLCLIAPFWNLPITGSRLRKHFGITEPRLELD